MCRCQCQPLTLGNVLVAPNCSVSVSSIGATSTSGDTATVTYAVLVSDPDDKTGTVACSYSGATTGNTGEPVPVTIGTPYSFTTTFNDDTTTI